MTFSQTQLKMNRFSSIQMVFYYDRLNVSVFRRKRRTQLHVRIATVRLKIKWIDWIFYDKCLIKLALRYSSGRRTNNTDEMRSIRSVNVIPVKRVKGLKLLLSVGNGTNV